MLPVEGAAQTDGSAVVSVNCQIALSPVRPTWIDDTEMTVTGTSVIRRQTQLHGGGSHAASAPYDEVTNKLCQL